MLRRWRLTGTGHNEGARLHAAYDALDCLHGMKIGLLDGMKAATFRDLTTPSKAENALERWRSRCFGPSLRSACRNAVARSARIFKLN